MSKVLRALMISAVATGTAALVVNVVKGNVAINWKSLIKQDQPADPQMEKKDRFVDAEDLSDEERSQLTDELNAML